jgi:hypothetical protein
VGPLTQVNMMIGTPGYMSPEQIEGGEVDHRSDIFAVGAVCYELLSYNEAFSGANTGQVERRVLQGKPAPLASVVPGLDPEIDEIVQRALKRDPNKRYQDAATFEKALDRVRSRLEPETSQGHRPTPPPPQNVRGMSREVRADAAYKHALIANQGGAPTAARRFAVEALAEDPSHAGARALLARLDARPSPIKKPQPAAPEPAVGTFVNRGASPPVGKAGPTMVGHAGSTSVGGAGSTFVGGAGSTFVGSAGSTSVSNADSTFVGDPDSTFVGNSPSTMASAPTIIVTPGKARGAPRLKQGPAVWSADGLKKRYEEFWRRDRTSRQRQESFGTRYRRAMEIVALVVIVAAIVAVLIWLGMGLRSSGQLLTITKPVGGTISTAGITCGSRGADCVAKRPNGDAIELRPEADAGFTFVGYTGDCAPGGRTIMTAPRICGATFAPVAESRVASEGATQPLTIAPVPTGGTLEGLDIICGTKGSVCSANHPDGVPVELHPTADEGFTFMGFTGDCVPLGHTQMTGPRTCGATFSRTDVVSAQPPPKVVEPKGGKRAAAGGPSPSPPEGAANPLRPSVVNPQPPPPSSSGGKVSEPQPETPVAPPISDEAFAKGKIQELVKEYCDAFEAIDPVRVQRVYPRIPMDSLTIQLNTSKYKSVQCKFCELKFVSLDPAAGTARVQAELKRVYEHTILTEKPMTSELIADIKLFRSNLRSPWLIDQMTFKPK